MRKQQAIAGPTVVTGGLTGPFFCRSQDWTAGYENPTPTDVLGGLDFSVTYFLGLSRENHNAA